MLLNIEQIEKMRKAGKITAIILKEMSEMAKPGVTPIELNTFAEKRCKELGVLPAFKGYKGFPKSVCISINDTAVHGIPNDIPLQSTDLLKLDFGVIFEGFYGDSAVTVPMPECTVKDHLLSEVTRKALMAGIAELKIGNKSGACSAVIQRVVEENGFTVVKTLCGHGIGTALHQDEKVPNFGKHYSGFELQEGMALAIEPVVASESTIYVMDDGWTIKTKHGSRAAHWEHSVILTKNGPEILTLP